MHHDNGQAAAKRIGVSYKTLLRWIEKGKIRPEEAKIPIGVNPNIKLVAFPTIILVGKPLGDSLPARIIMRFSSG